MLLAAVGGIGVGAASWAAPKMLLLSLAVAAVVALYLRSRIYALMLFVIVRPLVDAFGGNFSEVGLSAGSWWAVGVTMMAAIVLTQESRARSLNLPPRVLPVFGLGAAYLVIIVFYPGGRPFVAGLFALASWTLLCLAVAALCESREKQLTVVRCVDGAAIVLSASVLMLVLRNQYGALYYSADSWRTWNADTMALPHSYALFAALLMPIMLAQVHAHYHAKLAAALSVLLSLVVLLSYVRSAYFALFLVWVVFVAQALRLSPLRVRLTAAFVTIGAAVAGYMSRAEILQRMDNLLLLRASGGAANMAGSNRWGWWRELARGSTDTSAHLLLGQGAGGSRRILMEQVGLAVWSHNDFLEFLVSGGVVLLDDLLHLHRLDDLVHPPPGAGPAAVSAVATLCDACVGGDVRMDLCGFHKRGNLLPILSRHGRACRTQPRHAHDARRYMDGPRPIAVSACLGWESLLRTHPARVGKQEPLWRPRACRKPSSAPHKAGQAGSSRCRTTQTRQSPRVVQSCASEREKRGCESSFAHT